MALRPSAPALAHPQRVILRVEGEQIVDVEYRPETGDGSPFARVGRMGFEQIVAAATAACPTCGMAHALALCQAVEALAAIAIPARAKVLRVAAAELERATSHLATVATIFEALALPEVAAAFAAEGRAAAGALLSLRGKAPGGWLVPGGVAQDLADEGRGAIARVMAESLERLFTLADKTIAQRLLLARTVEVGVITLSAAEQFGLGGPLARAVGLKADLRLDAPYAAYDDLQTALVTQEGGDVYARITVLIFEALESLKLAGRAVHDLPVGPIRGALPQALPAGIGEAAVEAPRGPVHYKVAAEGGRLSAVSCKPAPQLDRLLTRAALVNATVDDSALIFVSTDPCDTCLGMTYDF
ncbi:MAG: hypothetical protein HGA45_07875 [Chloroflexales bacterium]|nr:hypothetical protein [Chloroflexales bacterium]